jgi:predicted nucleic acid-binding protein
VDLVLDASTTIAWALNGSNRLAARTWESMKGDQALVPTLWWFELRNALVVNERRGRITEQQTARFLRNVERLAITIDGTPDESGVLTLARRHRLTVYDAAYLELAVRNALPLATLDALQPAPKECLGSAMTPDSAMCLTRTRSRCA